MFYDHLIKSSQKITKKTKNKKKKELVYNLVPQYEQKIADSLTLAVPQLGQ